MSLAYGVTIANPSATLPQQRVTDMLGLGMGWMRYQVDWSNVEVQQSPVVYNWAKLDDAISKCNAAGILPVIPIQNGPAWAQTLYDWTAVAGTLTTAGATLPYYLNTGGGICQVDFTGSTWSAGTSVVLESSADGFAWTLMQTWNSTPGMPFVDVSTLYFIRLHCVSLQSGDSITATMTATEVVKSNSGTIAANNQTVFVHLNSDTIWYEFAFAGVINSDSTLLLQKSADNVTFTTFRTITGAGTQLPLVFGVNPTVTTSSAAIPAGTQVVTPLSMTNISVGTQLTIDIVKSGVQEVVTVTATTGTTFTAIFVNSHLPGCSIFLAVYMRAKASGWHTGDSVVVTISGTGPSPATKYSLNPSNVLSFAQAVAHRYTPGDPANVNGMSIGAIEIYNEGADDNSDALLKTPQYMVQAMQACYAAIKAISPTVKVGAGAHLQLTKAHIQTWQQAFYLYGGGPYSDYSNLHYYPGANDPTILVSGQSADLTFPQYWQVVHAIDVANGFGSTPIRVTEFGWTRGLEDTFSGNDSNLYTSNFFTGGSLGAWTFDLVNGQIIGTGGSRAAYYQTTNPAKFQGGYAEITVNWCEQAGMGLRWIDANNSYLCLINDASSATSPNTVQIIVRSAGVNTVVASSAISFPRGSSHLFHFQAIGHTPINPQTTLVVSMDGTQLLSIGDTTAGNQAGGFAYLYEDGRLQCQLFSMIQDGNVTYVQQAQYYQDVLWSAMLSGCVEACFAFTLDNSNGYSPVSVKAGVETQYPAYGAWQAFAQANPTWPTIADTVSTLVTFRDGLSDATFRTGETQATFRTGESGATFRTGETEATFRTGESGATFRDGVATTGGR